MYTHDADYGIDLYNLDISVQSNKFVNPSAAYFMAMKLAKSSPAGVVCIGYGKGPCTPLAWVPSSFKQTAEIPTRRRCLHFGNFPLASVKTLPASAPVPLHFRSPSVCGGGIHWAGCGSKALSHQMSDVPAVCIVSRTVRDSCSSRSVDVTEHLT